MRRIAARPASRLTVGLVAGILGLLAVGQFRGQAGVPGLAGLSAQDLTLLIANLNERNEQLRTEVADLSRQESRIAAANASGVTTVGQLRADLREIRAWAGVAAVTGRGVTVTVQGPIGGDGVEELLNELRNAGAEALAVGNVRLVPGSVVAGPPGGLSVENDALGDAFEIRAIGSPEILTGTLTRAGGVVDQIATTYPQAMITVTPTTGMTLPASERSLVPTYARPRL
jgi:uncharacterized protein YlxW (UPF0749 family)